MLGSDDTEGAVRENNFRAMQVAEIAGVAAMPEGVDPMPYLQSPGDLFMAFESTIDVAMQELRRFRGNLRDAEWKCNNGDQIVQSLLTLSKVCLSCAEQFVLRQESKQSPLKAAEHAAAAATPLAPPSLTPEVEDSADVEEAVEVAQPLDANKDPSEKREEDGGAQDWADDGVDEGESGSHREGGGDEGIPEHAPDTQEEHKPEDRPGGCEDPNEEGELPKSVTIEECSVGTERRSRVPHRRARSTTTTGDSLALRRALSEACVADLHAAGIPAQLQSLKDL